MENGIQSDAHRDRIYLYLSIYLPWGCCPLKRSIAIVRAMSTRSRLHTPTTVTPSRRPAPSRDFSGSPAHMPEPYETTHRPHLMVSRPGSASSLGGRSASQSGWSRASAKPQWSTRSDRPAAPAPSAKPQRSSARHHPLADVELDQLAHELSSRDSALSEADANAAALRSQLCAADAEAAALRSELGAAEAEVREVRAGASGGGAELREALAALAHAEQAP